MHNDVLVHSFKSMHGIMIMGPDRWSSIMHIKMVMNIVMIIIDNAL